jgi:hypothetical protein
MAATGAIRRDPRYAGRAEMKQVVAWAFITKRVNARPLPAGMRQNLNLNNDFAMICAEGEGAEFRFY